MEFLADPQQALPPAAPTAVHAFTPVRGAPAVARPPCWVRGSSDDRVELPDHEKLIHSPAGETGTIPRCFALPGAKREIMSALLEEVTLEE